MPKPPPPIPAAAAPDGRPPERAPAGRPARGRAAGPGRGSAGPTPAAADDAKGKQAGWGGVARKGAGPAPRRRAAGATRRPRPASGSGRAVRDWEPAAVDAGSPRSWIDEGEVAAARRSGAVGRGRTPARPGRRSPGRPRRARRGAAGPRTSGSRGPVAAQGVAAAKLERTNERVKEASKAFRRERYEEARKILRPLAEAAPTAVSVRELLGLTYYRLGRWKQAITELEAFERPHGQHRAAPGAGRLLPRPRPPRPGEELWEDLRDASPSAALVAEGRIVYAGSLADQGRLADAIAVLEARQGAGQAPAGAPPSGGLRAGRPARAGGRPAAGPGAVHGRRRERPGSGRRRPPASARLALADAVTRRS